MVVGQPIVLARRHPPALVQTLGPRQAMAETLSAYLSTAAFRTFGGMAADTTFSLRAVFPEWPDVSTELPYPCASVIEKTDTFYEAHNFVPTAVEETLGQFDCLVGCDGGEPSTVLWKLAEATCDFQIDYWSSNIPEREAIEANLGELFNPGEERSGVLLTGPDRYYSTPIRATLTSHRRIDTEGTVYPNERRLNTTVRCEVDVLQLRQATLLRPASTTVVTDPNDPPEEA